MKDINIWENSRYHFIVKDNESCRYALSIIDKKTLFWTLQGAISMLLPKDGTIKISAIRPSGHDITANQDNLLLETFDGKVLDVHVWLSHNAHYHLGRDKEHWREKGFNPTFFSSFRDPEQQFFVLIRKPKKDIEEVEVFILKYNQ